MKAVVTFGLILFFGCILFARDTRPSEQTASEIKVVRADVVPGTLLRVKPAKEGSIARLYRFKNSRVYKELSFTTRADKPKLA